MVNDDGYYMFNDGEQNNVHSPILKEAFPLPTAQALHVPMSQLDRHQPVLEPVSSPATSSTFKLTIDINSYGSRGLAKPFVAPVQPLRCVGSGSIQATNPCPVALQRRPYHRYSQAESCSKAWRSETSKTRFRHHTIICTSGFEIETGKKPHFGRKKHLLNQFLGSLTLIKLFSGLPVLGTWGPSDHAYLCGNFFQHITTLRGQNRKSLAPKKTLPGECHFLLQHPARAHSPDRFSLQIQTFHG